MKSSFFFFFKSVSGSFEYFSLACEWSFFIDWMGSDTRQGIDLGEDFELEITLFIEKNDV